MIINLFGDTRMSYQIWKKGRHDDYRFIDGAIADQFNMGGVDMWIYTYIGPAVSNNKSSDDTLNYNGSNGNLSSIGDLIFGETANRSYNLQAITLPAVYQIQEATPDLKIPGLFFNFDTMDITVHYNTMMQRIGRKIMPGDVLELPNLRDFDVIGKDTGLNRFYVVQDSFRTAEGYSATWQHHIFKLRVKPLTASPEFSAFGDNNYPDDPNDPNNGNGNSSNGESTNSNEKNELDIMNIIMAQADDEVPYIHWTNEHIYDDISGINELVGNILTDYEYPVNPMPEMFFNKLTYPVLYERENQAWVIVKASYGTALPIRASDGEFFFLEDSASVSGFSIYQYYQESRKWFPCVMPYTNKTVAPVDVEDFYCFYDEVQMYQYTNNEWVIPEPSNSLKPFTSKDIAANRTNPQDLRPSIPPARGSEGVGEGNGFPSNPKDGAYFYRTDYNPVTLWKYSDESKSWVQFNYGGRLPWVGPNAEQAKFINSKDRVSIYDVVKPNTSYRKKKDN